MKLLPISILMGLWILSQAHGARSVDVRALALGDDQAMPERYVKVENGFAAISFSAMQPGALVKALAVDAVLPLFELAKGPDGKMAYGLVEKISIPKDAKGVLLLGWGGPKGAKYLAIDDDYLSAKYNDWLLINTSARAISFQLGRDNKPILLNPNAVLHHQIKAAENVGVDVVGQVAWENKVKTFYSTYWPVRAGERGIVIFYDRGDRVALSRITDVLAKPEAVVEQGQPVATPPPVQAAR